VRATSGWPERLRCLVEALQAQPDPLEVLVDEQHIASGSRWRDEIEGMLVDCDAAEILITADALESAWVLTEATLLRARFDREYNHEARQPGFPLFPPYSMASTRNGFSNTTCGIRSGWMTSSHARRGSRGHRRDPEGSPRSSRGGASADPNGAARRGHRA
jgi:hypothetical protein